MFKATDTNVHLEYMSAPKYALSSHTQNNLGCRHKQGIIQQSSENMVREEYSLCS